MGCNQSTQRKQETTAAEAQPQEHQQKAEEHHDVVEAPVKDTTTDVIVASPVRATPASPVKMVASQQDAADHSLDHVAAEGPSEGPSQIPTPREQQPSVSTPVEITAVAVFEAAPEAPVKETQDSHEAAIPVEAAVPADANQCAPQVKDEAPTAETSETPVAVEQAPVANGESPAAEKISPSDAVNEEENAAPAVNVDDAPKAEARSPTVPVLALPVVAAPVATKRSKTPTKRAPLAATKTPSKTPAKAASKTPSKEAPSTAVRKVAFDKVPAQNPQEQRKQRAKKAAGRHQGNVSEEMFLASVAAFERQLTHRGNLDKQLSSR